MDGKMCKNSLCVYQKIYLLFHFSFLCKEISFGAHCMSWMNIKCSSWFILRLALFLFLLRFNLFRFGQTSAFHSFNHNSTSSSTYKTWFFSLGFSLDCSPRVPFTLFIGKRKHLKKLKKRKPIYLLCIYILGEHCVISPLSPMCICLYLYIAIHFLCDIDNLLCIRMATAMV